ncbi:hypothetical protein [Aquipseudomonas alcaligenes]|uniref:hypothetical protein n=1 Tax=Aquipseudomonas alcaligenes TaxID=43263 RepID=UPI00364B21CD
MSQQPYDLQQERELLDHFRQHSQGEPSAAVDALILDAARQAVSPPAPRPNPVQRLHAWLFGVGSRTRWSVAVAGLAVVGIGLNLALHTRDQLPQTYDAPAPALQEMAPVMEARKQSAESEYKKAEQAQRSNAGSTSFAVSPAANAAPRPIAPPTPQAAAPVGALADSVAPVETDVARDQAQATAMLKQKAQAAARSSEALEKPLAEASPKVLQETLNEDQLAETLGHSAVPEAPPLELRLRTLLQLRREGKQAEADRLLVALKQEFPQRDLESELKRLQREAEKPASSR